MKCQNRSMLYSAIKSHRDFHLQANLITDNAVRFLGIHKFPLTSPIYKIVKLTAYVNIAVASIALVVLE